VVVEEAEDVEEVEEMAMIRMEMGLEYSWIVMGFLFITFKLRVPIQYISEYLFYLFYITNLVRC